MLLSLFKVDRCGVCGGSGSSCPAEPAYSWQAAPAGECSVTCGGGSRAWLQLCQETLTGQQVAPNSVLVTRGTRVLLVLLALNFIHFRCTGVSVTRPPGPPASFFPAVR